MHTTRLAAAALLGSALLTACEEIPTGLGSEGLEASNAALAVSAGETYSHILITRPSARTQSLAVGASTQMAATLYYSRGGTLPAAPYAQWRSTNPCVASVTNASPSWGAVRGVSAGTTQIISEAWGRADTLTVTVTGTGDLDPACAASQWLWNFNDVSFTGTVASTYGVAAGEKLTQVVLFAGPRPDYTLARGSKLTLRSELWYDRGGKLNGRGYVAFSSTDASVATIDSKGIVTARGTGRTRIIARLGTSHADTVPLYVQ